MPDEKAVRLAVMLFTTFLSVQGNWAYASEPTLLYAGAAAGESRLDNREDFAWAALIGTRPLTALGAELQYVNLGHTSSSVSLQVPTNFVPNPFPVTLNKDTQARGVAAFAVAYVPLPISNFDIDLKAGLSRLDDTQTRTYRPDMPIPLTIDDCTQPVLALAPYCGPHLRRDQTNTKFAWGAGIQMHISHAVLRADFERFLVVGDHPSLLSLGVTWAFF